MRTAKVEGTLNNQKYSVISRSYADAIHILVHKNAKIARIYKCQLYPQPGGVLSEDVLVAGVTSQRLLGGKNVDTSGHLYTELIASLILKQAGNETRTLILGLGDIGPRDLGDINGSYREELLYIIKLVQEANVWS